MDEDTVNLEIRAFLKQFGVTSQRELEMAIHDAVEAGDLSGDVGVSVSATLRAESLDLEHVVEDTIELEH
ncbi:MAG: DUF6494 family protein [Halobacteriota archaeon]